MRPPLYPFPALLPCTFTPGALCRSALPSARPLQMMAELHDAVKELEQWDGPCVIVTGAEGTFCSGADLSVVRSHMAEVRAVVGVGDGPHA